MRCLGLAVCVWILIFDITGNVTLGKPAGRTDGCTNTDIKMIETSSGAIDSTHHAVS
jgi:hypothetical protein